MNPTFDPSKMGAMLAGLATIMIVAVGVGLIISAIVCYIVVNLYKAVPADKRELDPSKVWFLVIPCVPLVYNFWVFPGLGRSIRAAVTAKGGQMDDLLEKLGLWYSICCACCIVPCLNYLAGPAALVLLIVFLVKGYDQKKNMA